MPELIVDLSQARVSITSAFQGESLLLFGMFDPPGEIVVVVQGPPARETVMRKERFLGLWLNTGRQRFDDVPAYYFIAASAPLAAPAGARRGRRDPVARGPAVEHPAGALALARGARQVPRRAGRGEAARGPLPGRFRPGDGAGRPAVPGRAALPVAPAGGGLRRAHLSPARRQDRGRGVAALAGRQGRLQRPAGRLVDDRRARFTALAPSCMALVLGWLGGAVLRRL